MSQEKHAPIPMTASGFATPREVDSTKAFRPKRRLVVRGSHQGVLLELGFDSIPSGYVVRHLAGVGGEGATVYRMNTWDVDGVTPTGESLKPAKATPAKATPPKATKPAPQRPAPKP